MVSLRHSVTAAQKTVVTALLVLSSASLAFAEEPERTGWFRDITIPAGETAESITCIFCSIRVDGEVRGDATTEWGDIDVRGTVGKSATAVAGEIRLGAGAQIKGDSVSVFGDTVLGDNARIEGDVVASLGTVRRSPGATTAKQPVIVPLPLLSWLPSRARTVALFWLLALIVSLPLAFLCLVLLRPRLETLVETMKARRWRTLFLGSIIFAILIAALQFGGDSDYADWLELPLTILLALLSAPGYTALGLRLGRRLHKGTRMALLLGVVLLVTLQVVPLAGWLVGLILMIFSLGSPLAAIGFRMPEVSTNTPSDA